ncbi:MAG TPA: ATP-binding protein [Polyangiaceae bacterium]|nr:ATP-binding protein [Polyangiaceae bacterium]
MGGPEDEEGDRALREDVARAETALRESEQRFRMVVQGAPDGVAILRGPVILYLNPRAARLLGVKSPEDGYGRPITDFLHPDDIAEAADRIGRLMRTGQPLDGAYEYRSRSLDGRELTVEISAIPIDFDGGRAVLAFARDVTERKAMQARLAQADRLAALGMLSAGVAHEINNPLAYALLNLELVVRDLEKGGEVDRAAVLGRLREARHGGERVATIVRDLKSFVREDENTRWPVELGTVLESALNVVGSEIAKRGRVARRFSNVPPVEGIAARLEQVFVNLLLNAAQALPEDAVSTNEVGVRVEHDDDFVWVMVKDTGLGMTEDVKKRIFDPFFTTKPAGVGTGLGLPICLGIVTAHGGTLEVESAPGQGSTFTVKLKRYYGDFQAREQPTSPLATTRGRILIIDDDIAVGRTLRLALEEEHDVTVVVSAAEALRTLHAADGGGDFDAILCDLLMPGMTGAELFTVARRELPQAAPRFIFMSGGYWAENEPSPTGTQPVLEKPFNLEQVRSLLRDVVSRSRRQSVRAGPTQ